MRIFLGVETANAEMELASAANYLAMITNGRAVKKNNLHVTVKYFGSVQSVNSISRIEETMDKVCARTKPFYLQVDCAARIPGRDMVCALLSGELGELETFSSDVDKEMYRIGYRKTRRKPYMPHVTLAYDLKQKWEDDDVRLQKIPFLVSRMTLFESVYQNGENYFIPLYSSEFRG